MILLVAATLFTLVFYTKFSLLVFLTNSSVYDSSRSANKNTSSFFDGNGRKVFLPEIVPKDVAKNEECHLPTFLKPTVGSRTLLVVIAFNRADIIELNYATALAFLPSNSFEYVVFDGSFRSQPEVTRLIKEMCKRLDIKYIRLPATLERGESSARHASKVQWILREYAAMHDGRVWFLDGDMFLLRDWVWEETMPESKYDIMTVLQTRALNNSDDPHASYIWPGFFVFQNIKNIPDLYKMGWSGVNINGALLDSGGETYFWLKSHPYIRVKHMPQASAGDIRGHIDLYRSQTRQSMERIRRNPDLYRLIWPDNPDPSIDYAHEFLGDYHILHYRSASNWNREGPEYHAKKWTPIKSAVLGALREKKFQNDRELEAYQQCRKDKKI